MAAVASALSGSQEPPISLEQRGLAAPEKYGAFLGDEGAQVRAISAKRPVEAPGLQLRLIPPPPIIKAITRAVAERAGREIAWLSRNRHLYANHWIALDGDTLLAVGNSAREVYAAIAGQPGTPLVIRVEETEGENFAGW